MSLVMFPACAKAADGAEPTQERIKTKAAGSLARELVIQGPPFVICSPGSSTVLGPRHPPSRCGEDVHEASGPRPEGAGACNLHKIGGSRQGPVFTLLAALQLQLITPSARSSHCASDLQ